MTDETKRIFDAPWGVNNRTYPFDVTESDGFWACECSTLETANRISRLPELYDALNKQTYFRCVDCLRHTAKTIDDISINKDMIEHGCPKNRTDCGAFDVWPLLKKVRDGE